MPFLTSAKLKPYIAADLSVADLVLRARRGDRRGFEELIRRYERMALAVAYGVLGDAHLAGDVAQEAFLKAWRRLDGLTQSASFAPWLCGIVRNLCVDQKRRRTLVLRGIEEAREEADGRTGQPAELLERRELSQIISAALATLDATTRSAIVLRYYDNLSSKEIGELLGLSPAAIDMRLMRGRQALKHHPVLRSAAPRALYRPTRPPPGGDGAKKRARRSKGLCRPDYSRGRGGDHARRTSAAKAIAAAANDLL